MTDPIDTTASQIIDTHEATYHPGRPCPENAQGYCAESPRPVPSFAQALDADERAQLDARAATAEQERDDILHDLRHTKADRDRLNGLLREAEHHITRLEHRHLTASDRADKAIAARYLLLTDLDALARTIATQANENDNLRQQLDRCNTERARLAEELADEVSQREQADQMADRLAQAIARLTGHDIGEHSSENDPWQNALNAAAGLGSSRRAQGRCICPILPGGPLVQAERDPDCSVHGQDARPAQDGYAQGYAEAVARLRDDARYGNWWSSSPESLRPTQPIRGHLADYLETVGPDGPDVERPVRRPAAELERLLAGMLDRDIQPEPTDPVGTAAVDTALRALDAFLTVVNAATQWRTGWADDAGQTMPHSQIRDLIVAVDELLASWPGMDLSVPAVSIAEVAAETTIPTTPGAYHWGRAWAPSDIEANCPCPKAPCGYVVRDQESPDCDQHSGNRTMRGGHSAERCAEDRP